MTRMLAKAVILLLANAAGLLVAMLLLNGFSIDLMGFVTALLLFTLASVIAEPILTKISQKNLPALAGGVALVTTFVGLLLTSLLLKSMNTGGMVNLFQATLIVWLVALIVGMILPKFLLTKYLQDKKS